MADGPRPLVLGGPSPSRWPPSLRRETDRWCSRVHRSNRSRSRSWRAPERFVAKGRDGETDIWGIVVRPTDHDPARKYPVVEQIYAGPHGAHVPKDFRKLRPVQESSRSSDSSSCRSTGWGPTGARSRSLADVAWKNLDAGFPDRKAWLKALGAADPSVDLTRVGIYGGSAGGQNAMRAPIDHNDVYSVAVADCGCHDNRMDKIWWNELWMSWPVGPHYIQSSNVEQAHRTEGELLLIVGGSIATSTRRPPCRWWTRPCAWTRTSTCW